MKTFETLPAGFSRRQIILAMGAVAGLSACGGGGGVAAVGSGGTGAFSGVITGFGSIIVHGVRYADSVSITNDLGIIVLPADLRLGMVVVIPGATAVVDGRSTPSSIVVSSKLLGPITSIDIPNKRFVVLGQTVEVTGSTVFDASLPSGFAALAAGTIVEVYGLTLANGDLRATFIDRETSPSAFKLEGVISNLNTAARTFSIGLVQMQYGTAIISADATLANGATVRVRLNVTPVNNVWTVIRIQRPPETALEDRSTWMEVTAPVTAFTSPTNFWVGGIRVDATAALFPDGTAFLSGPAARAEVEGRVVNGVLYAAEVEKDDGNWWSKITGVVTAFTSPLSFHVNGIPVNATGQTAFTDGTAFLKEGAGVEVEGRVENGALVATEIEKDDGDELAEITGSISAFRSITDFDVNGLRVNATRAAFPDGTAFLSASGARVEVEGKVVNGVLLATEVEQDDGDEAEITGLVTAFTDSNNFHVNGIPVNATGAAFPDGTAFLRVGAGVEVEGSLVNGTLRATDVGELSFELYGTVSSVSVSGTSGSFTLTSSRGIVVQVVWDANTYLPLTLIDLVNGARVKVEASSDGSRMRANFISFQDFPN